MVAIKAVNTMDPLCTKRTVSLPFAVGPISIECAQWHPPSSIVIIARGRPEHGIRLLVSAGIYGFDRGWKISPGSDRLARRV